MHGLRLERYISTRLSRGKNILEYGKAVAFSFKCFKEAAGCFMQMRRVQLLCIIFFVINILFFLFSHTTSQHNIHSKQTKQSNRHILHILKVQSKGRERGREKVTTKQVLPLYQGWGTLILEGHSPENPEKPWEKIPNCILQTLISWLRCV